MQRFNYYFKKHSQLVASIMQDALNLLPENTRAAAAYACKAKGKGLRPGLVLLCAAIAEKTLPEAEHQPVSPTQASVPNGENLTSPRIEKSYATTAPAYRLAAAVEFIHIASLLHDDIEDDACLRRGQASAHLVFGPCGALIAGDALLALGMNLAANCAPLKQQIPQDAYSAKLVRCLSEGLLATVCGQIKDLEGDAKLDGYLLTATGKTASLMAAACAGGALLAGGKDMTVQALKNFGLNLGVAYQLLDDWLDFAPSLYTGKTQGADLNAGKLSLPLYFYLKDLPEKEQNDFLQKMKSKTFDERQKKEVIENILLKNLAPEIKHLIATYTRQAEMSLIHLAGSPEKDILLSLNQAVANLCPDLENLARSAR